jgi:hypothetical protein
MDTIGLPREIGAQEGLDGIDREDLRSGGSEMRVLLATYTAGAWL